MLGDKKETVVERYTRAPPFYLRHPIEIPRNSCLQTKQTDASHSFFSIHHYLIRRRVACHLSLSTRNGCAERESERRVTLSSVDATPVSKSGCPQHGVDSLSSAVPRSREYIYIFFVLPFSSSKPSLGELAD